MKIKHKQLGNKLMIREILTTLVLIVFLAMSMNSSFAQTKVKLTLNDYLEEYETSHSFTIRDSNQVISFKVISPKKKYKPNEKTEYYWFFAKEIKVTQGGYDGRLLHGEYSSMYNNKQLSEKGVFKYGLKTGNWRSWYENGKMKEVSNWKRGNLHGSYKQYDANGQLVKSEQYKKGEIVIKGEKEKPEKEKKSTNKDKKTSKEKKTKQLKEKKSKEKKEQNLENEK